MLTNFCDYISTNHASYTSRKYSDFGQTTFYKIFQIWQGIKVYNKPMSILDNLENSIDFDRESHQSLAVKVFSDTCCNGCSCKTDNDHTKEAVLGSNTNLAK